jgi:hypothetical protein
MSPARAKDAHLSLNFTWHDDTCSEKIKIHLQTSSRHTPGQSLSKTLLDGGKQNVDLKREGLDEKLLALRPAAGEVPRGEPLAPPLRDMRHET